MSATRSDSRRVADRCAVERRDTIALPVGVARDGDGRIVVREHKRYLAHRGVVMLRIGLNQHVVIWSAHYAVHSAGPTLELHKGRVER